MTETYHSSRDAFTTDFTYSSKLLHTRSENNRRASVSSTNDPQLDSRTGLPNTHSAGGRERANQTSESRGMRKGNVKTGNDKEEET